MSARAADRISEWDVIVVGTGMGGATLGHRLAMAGHRVLFIEKGHDYPTERIDEIPDKDDPQQRLNAAHWPEPIGVRIDGVEGELHAALGCGAGGSTLLYAAALERFERTDVEPVEGLSHPTGGWPMRWPELSRYYEEAERLFHVLGTGDPLAGESRVMPPPPPASAVDAQLMRDFERQGLHPYRLHVGVSYRPNCGECGGRRCVDLCKRDAWMTCLEPALRSGNARLLTDCEVERIEADETSAQGVVYRRRGRLHRARGRFIVLAAGAYRSPAILLRSRSPLWPEGLANGSGQVGRNLMLHANEWFAVWPTGRASKSGPRKTIGLRDFYVEEGMRIGSIQSTGLSASFGNILGYLVARFDRSRFRGLKPLRKLLHIPARLVANVLGQATIFVMLIEDFAYPDNRVVLDPRNPGRINIEYTIRNELRRRTRKGRRLFTRTLKGMWRTALQVDVQLNFGHPCGTCRFGYDPATSVLDPQCKTHEVDNLYVADASFMPSSGGANPALTIAANAIRVGDVLDRRLRALRARTQESAVAVR